MATQSKYPQELRDRAVGLVLEERELSGQPRGAVARVARRMGLPAPAVRRWVRDAEAEHREIARPVAPTITGGDAPPVDESSRPDVSEILAEVHALRSDIDRADKRRRRRMTVTMIVMLALIPLGVLAAHFIIDYESGRVAEAIERSSGPFTDEALRRVCRTINIPIFGPETKKRLGCPRSSEPTTTTTSEPSTGGPPPPATEPTTTPP